MTRTALYSRHTRLADTIARDYWLPGADRDDVIQEARLALWIATGTFGPGRGCSFATYARRAIKADLRDKLQAATRNGRRLLSEAARDEQLELVGGPSLERTVVARERLREALSRRHELEVRDRRRARDRERKRRAA